MSEKLEADKLIEFIRNLYPDAEAIPLHSPQFSGNEKNISAMPLIAPMCLVSVILLKDLRV